MSDVDLSVDFVEVAGLRLHPRNSFAEGRQSSSRCFLRPMLASFSNEDGVFHVSTVFFDAYFDEVRLAPNKLKQLIGT